MKWINYILTGCILLWLNWSWTMVIPVKWEKGKVLLVKVLVKQESKLLDSSSNVSNFRCFATVDTNLFIDRVQYIATREEVGLGTVWQQNKSFCCWICDHYFANEKLPLPPNSGNIIKMEQFTSLSTETKLNEVRCTRGTVLFLLASLLFWSYICGSQTQKSRKKEDYY